jgi:hypothetical protein
LTPSFVTREANLKNSSAQIFPGTVSAFLGNGGSFLGAKMLPGTISLPPQFYDQFLSCFYSLHQHNNQRSKDTFGNTVRCKPGFPVNAQLVFQHSHAKTGVIKRFTTLSEAEDSAARGHLPVEDTKINHVQVCGLVGDRSNIQPRKCDQDGWTTFILTIISALRSISNTTLHLWSLDGED